MTTAQDEFKELFRDKSRRTRHPEDDVDAHSSRSDDDLLSDLDEPSALPNNLPSRDHVPRNKSYSNTGPKGVIADAQAFEAARRERSLPRKGATPEHSRTREVARKSGSRSGSDVESEDGFMAEWRQKRLNQLTSNGHQTSNSVAQPRSRATYGAFVSVDGEGFLDAVDRSPANTVVVVFIYDDSSEVSYMVEDCMRQLARQHKVARFVKMHYLDAEMEPAGVPAVLAYRGGEKFAGLIPVVDEIPDDAELSSTTLEHLFKKYVSQPFILARSQANISSADIRFCKSQNSSTLTLTLVINLFDVPSAIFTTGFFFFFPLALFTEFSESSGWPCLCFVFSLCTRGLGAL
jgi:hypothetical protein